MLLLLALALGLLLVSGLIAPARAQGELPPLYPSPNERFGVCVIWENSPGITNYDVAQLNAGWYLDFADREAPPRPAGMEYVQLVRVGEPWYDPATITTTLAPIIDANPGSLWLIGNEPDRRGIQDDRIPAEYAVIYHDLYYLIKQRDPTSRVAIGGIVQPTPIRRLYLDFVLDEYEARYGSKIPVDVWNIHNFILPETASWGAGIPPGMDDYQDLGMGVDEYGLQNHDNIGIFRQQIWDFRQWMADHGEQDKPLIVSEYGILMPVFYGFDHPRVRDFMLATFDFFLNTTDAQLGYPLDDDRLVQRWSWYSLNDYVYDEPPFGVGFNGNLFDHDTAEIKPLGLDYAAYTANLVVPYVDLAIGKSVAPAAAGPGDTITYTISFANTGNTVASDVTITDLIPGEVAVIGVYSHGVAITDTGAVPGYAWAVADLAPDSGGVITVTGQVSAVVPVPVVVTSTATIVGAEDDARPGNDDAVAAFTLSPPVCPACDVNGDDVIDIVDVGLVAGRWQDPANYAPQYDVWPPAAADQVIDVFDIMAVAAQWQAVGS